MGNLLKLLSKSNDEGLSNIVIDFETSVPNEEEKAIYNNMAQLIDTIDNITDLINNWSDPISLANISSPIVENCINKIKCFLKIQEMFEQLNSNFPALVAKLFHNCDKVGLMDGGFFMSQALARIFVQVLNSCFRFDVAKVYKPQVSNDLSALRKMHSTNVNVFKDLDVNSDKLSILVMKLANCKPMNHEIMMMTTNYLKMENIDLNKASKTITSLSTICMRMNSDKHIYENFQTPENRVFVLNVMTSLLILADHISPDGLLSSPSFDFEIYLKLICTFESESEVLVKYLRYQSKTGNSDDMKSSVKNIYKSVLGKR